MTNQIFLLFYIFLLSIFFFFLKKIGKNVEYNYLYGLYRLGSNLKFLEKFSKSKLIYLFEIFSIPVGFLLMILAILLIFYGIKTQTPTIAPVIPGLEIYGIKFPIFEVIVAIFISALIHEIAHAILILKNKVNIKSFGIFFFGPFLGAFVEPSEDVFKLKKIKQIAIFHAGIFANILLAGFVFILIYFLNSFNLFTQESSVYIVGKVPNITNVENISVGTKEKVLYIGGNEVKKLRDIAEILKRYSPGEEIEIVTEKNKYSIKLSELNGKPFMGFYFKEESKFGYLFNILFWIFIISLGIGLGNSLPIAVLDGGQSLRVLLNMLIKDEKKALKVHSIISYLIIFAILFNLLFLFRK